MMTIARLLAVCLLPALVGCTRWEAPRALPAPEDGPVSINAVRLTPRSTGMVVLRKVEITADSVIGWAPGATDPSGLLSGPRTRVAVHRSQVLLFEPATPDPWATAGAVVLAVLAAYGLIAAYFVGKSG